MDQRHTEKLRGGHPFLVSVVRTFCTTTFREQDDDVSVYVEESEGARSVREGERGRGDEMDERGRERSKDKKNPKFERRDRERECVLN
ncbi:hypothetical protein BVRB_7g178790 [Beta vulgaris subsp. vulgaris]|uniref:Uncharacterized protein n=1 Tax=Beta vulgaris subsp. vulgaris TaxID=3555 RepID=A0A0J8BAV9_BETVV|nr:hypothetical protein BVRB_7g178790 [Beta vulgaris subsp. vulgaris]